MLWEMCGVTYFEVVLECRLFNENNKQFTDTRHTFLDSNHNAAADSSYILQIADDNSALVDNSNRNVLVANFNLKVFISSGWTCLDGSDKARINISDWKWSYGRGGTCTNDSSWIWIDIDGVRNCFCGRALVYNCICGTRVNDIGCSCVNGGAVNS